MESNNNNLAKISMGMSIVLFICVIILFFRSPAAASADGESANAKNDSAVSKRVVHDGDALNIAYFDMDSLNANSDFVKQLEKDIEQANKDAEIKMQRKQKEIDNWRKGWEDRGTLLSTEQVKYQEEAQQMQMDAMQFEQEVQNELAQKQERLMMAHVTRITNFSKRLAEEKGYDMIFSYQLGQNLMYATPSIDVTDQLVKILNDDFRSMHGAPGQLQEEGNE